MSPADVRQLARSPLIFEGLAYDPASKAVSFKDEIGAGAVDLMTGATLRGEQLAPQLE